MEIIDQQLMSVLVRVAGLLHFCQIPAMVAAPRMLGWKSDLAKLEPINLRIVQVMGLAIILVVIGLGIVVAVASPQLVDGSAIAIGMTGFLGTFWFYRAFVQIALYSRIWPGGLLGLASHYGLPALFLSLTAIYFTALVSNFRL